MKPKAAPVSNRPPSASPVSNRPPLSARGIQKTEGVKSAAVVYEQAQAEDDERSNYHFHYALAMRTNSARKKMPSRRPSHTTSSASDADADSELDDDNEVHGKRVGALAPPQEAFDAQTEEDGQEAGRGEQRRSDRQTPPRFAGKFSAVETVSQSGGGAGSSVAATALRPDMPYESRGDSRSVARFAQRIVAAIDRAVTGAPNAQARREVLMEALALMKSGAGPASEKHSKAQVNKLAAVRQTLLESLSGVQRRTATSPAAAQTLEDLNMLLPLMGLNADRPRTARQVDGAIATLTVLTRRH